MFSTIWENFDPDRDLPRFIGCRYRQADLDRARLLRRVTGAFGRWVARLWHHLAKRLHPHDWHGPHLTAH